MFKYKNTPKPALQPVTDFYGQIFIESMSSFVDKTCSVFAIGDHVKSVVLAKPTTMNNETTIVELSRNVEPHSITAVCMLNEKQLLAADSNGNIMAMSQSQNPIYNDERFQKLDICAAFHVGPQVTCMMAGSIGDINEDYLQSPVLFGSRSGSVGMVAQLKDPQLYEALLTVQERLQTVEEIDGGRFYGKLAKPDLIQNVVSGDVLFRIFGMADPLKHLAGLDIEADRLLSIIESLYNSV